MSDETKGPMLSRRAAVPLMLAGGAAAWNESAMAQARIPAGKSAPVQLADAAQGIVLQPGVHRVDANTTVRTDLALMPGAQIEVSAGRTLTVLGHFSAPVAHVFTGPGQIDLNRSRTPAAYPEWWGARTDDGNADCLPALRASLAAHPVMLLRAADYYMADTFVVERSFCRIWGSGYRGTIGGQGTRLLVRSGAADVLRVGPASYPGSVNAFVQEVDLRWMELGRTAPVDSSAREPAGLRAQYVLHSQFEGLSSRESAVGFSAVGVVRSYFRDCIAFRSQPGKGAGKWRGFALGGLGTIGLAGANGSIYLIDCNASIGGSPGVEDSVGLLVEGGFADTFVVNLEVSGLRTGIRILGETGKMGAAAVSGHANLHLRMPVLDQCASAGIEIADTSEYSLIDISDPYVAVAAGARAAIALDRVHGATTIVGGQLVGRSDSAGRRATGLLVEASSGIDVTGLKIADFGAPVMVRNCSGLSLQGQVHNALVTSSAAAVRLDGCRDATVRIGVSGKPRAFAAGIDIADTRVGPVLVETNRLSAVAIAGSAVTSGNGALRSPGRHGSIVLSGT